MKLLLTVGAQMPFDRLVAAVDAWAGLHPEHEIVAQIGETELRPRHLRSQAFLEPAAFEEACSNADVLVGHAGIGTLFAAMERGKHALVLPRRAGLRETRNDHQLATARRFAEYAGVRVAWDETELAGMLDGLHAAGPLAAQPPPRDTPLLRALSAFVDGE